MVTIDKPAGPHPYFKTALSIFDFLGKHLLLHYRGRTDLATEPEKVNISELRGHKNGAFRTYKKMETDDWDFKTVIKDPDLGGFVEAVDGNLLLTLNNGDSDTKDPNNKRGVICPGCGGFMRQTSPNCFSCSRCGEKMGGCGM